MEVLMENIVYLFNSYNLQRNIKFLKNNQQGLNLSDQKRMLMPNA